MFVVKKSTAQKKAHVIVDSPHSGTDYPEDFKSPLPYKILRQCEDNFIDQLITGLEAQGADTLTAHFPRLYIDVNRALSDLREIDFPKGCDQLDIGNSRSARQGRGLIWQWVLEGGEDNAAIPIYDPTQKPSQEDILGRINGYWKPYHETLGALISENRYLAKQEGKSHVYHFNVHSCPRHQIRNGRKNKDIILGNVFNKSASSETLMFVKQIFEKEGFSVSLNRPFSGGYIVKKHGNPEKGVESIQIEICKDLYMNEENYQYEQEKAKRVKRALSKLVQKTSALSL